jgi:hypothetical protein
MPALAVTSRPWPQHEPPPGAPRHPLHPPPVPRHSTGLVDSNTCDPHFQEGGSNTVEQLQAGGNGAADGEAVHHHPQQQACGLGGGSWCSGDYLSSPYGVTTLVNTNMARTSHGGDAPPSRTQPLESVPIGTSPLLGGDPTWV